MKKTQSKSISNMNVLLLGSDGLIGSAIRSEIQLNVNLICLTRKNFDFRDTNRLTQFLANNSVDVVINAAGKVSGIQGNIKSPATLFLENAEVSLSILRACYDAKILKMIQFASACVYPQEIQTAAKEGMIGSGYVEETSRGYAYAKLMAIEGLRAIKAESGLHWTTLIPTNIYGEGDWKHGNDGHVIAMLVRKFLEAKSSKNSKVEVWGDGTAVRNFLHVNDLAKAAIQLIERDSFAHSELNVASDSETTIADLAKLISMFVEFKGNIVFDSKKPSGTKVKLLDDSTIRALGWRPTISLEKGLQSYSKTLASLIN